MMIITGTEVSIKNVIEKFRFVDKGNSRVIRNRREIFIIRSAFLINSCKPA